MRLELGTITFTVPQARDPARDAMLDVYLQRIRIVCPMKI